MKRGSARCSCSECRRRRRSPTAELHAAVKLLVNNADEKHRRLIAALEAMELERGGIQKVSEITGLHRTTISRGIQELKKGGVVDGRVREPGGGRKPGEKKGPGSVAGPAETHGG